MSVICESATCYNNCQGQIWQPQHELGSAAGTSFRQWCQPNSLFLRRSLEAAPLFSSRTRRFRCNKLDNACVRFLFSSCGMRCMNSILTIVSGTDHWTSVGDPLVKLWLQITPPVCLQKLYPLCWDEPSMFLTCAAASAKINAVYSHKQPNDPEKH